MEEKYIVALEIGSSKIKGAVGTVDSNGSLSVKAIEEEKLIDGVRYGCIRNVAETANAVSNVITRLEQREAQRKVTGVYVSVGGRSLSSQIIEIERRLPTEMEITREMITDITNDALAYPLHERSVICVTPREFKVDNCPTNPVGMMGSHISARLNLVSCRNQLMRNLHVVLDERLHLRVHETFVRQLAEADLVLFTEEKRLGCMLVDFGAETTTVSIYKNNVLQYLATIPMGSRNITRDITTLNHLEERAEELKIMGGNALSSPEHATVYNQNGTDYSQINNYVAARAGEIIANISEQIKYARLTPEKLPGGIIIIGKGAKLNGFNARLESATSMKVRVGAPGTHIRITDGRIQPSDAVDVISVLAAAAKCMPVQECMTKPPTVFTSPSPVAEDSIFPGAATSTATAHRTAQPTVSTPAPHPKQEEQAKPTVSRPQAPKIENLTQEVPEEAPTVYASGSRKSPLNKAWEKFKVKFVEAITEKEEEEDEE